MKMNIDYLTELVFKKIQDGEVYTEIPLKQLNDIIKKHLDAFYTNKVKLANVKLGLRKTKGENISEVDYQETLAEVQNTTLKHAYAIAAINQSDLDDLKEMNKL